jgi:hypothetical protein
MISLITATGGRPEAFGLLETWIAGQTFRDFEWIVVDDGPEPTPMNFVQKVYRPHPLWDGKHTLLRNLLVGLNAARGDKILFIEDDEVYLPDYLGNMNAMLDAAPLAGEIPARYYNIRQRAFREIGNHGHASLCQTGIRAELKQKFMRICSTVPDGSPFVDLTLWKNNGVLNPAGNVISIKGMPGRRGIGIGHRETLSSAWTADPDLKVLKRWIGIERAGRYEPYAHMKPPVDVR